MGDRNSRDRVAMGCSQGVCGGNEFGRIAAGADNVSRQSDEEGIGRRTRAWTVRLTRGGFAVR